MKLDMHQLFGYVDQIPRIPEIIKKLLEKINEPNQDFDKITDNIEQEPLLSIKVLRLANSPHLKSSVL